MTVAEVIALLGEPQKVGGMKRVIGSGYYLCFGQLEIPDLPQPAPYRFIVGFKVDDLVWMKSDPFGGVFSRDGLPSKPKILIPLEGSVFEHYPRVLDLRWQPVSGVYPMSYDIEVSSMREEERFVVDREQSGIQSTYFLTEYGGAGYGRFRVRGRNKRGIGEWSEYRNFLFLV